MGDEITSLPPFLQASPHQLDESLDLLASALSAITYGIALTLYCIVVHSLRCRRRSSRGSQYLITLSYTTLAMACITAVLIISHYGTQMAYVYHRDDLPGGPVVYEELMISSYFVALVIMAILDWLTMGVQIWRLWIIWRVTPWFIYIIIIPFSLLLACIGIDIAVLVNEKHISFLSLDYVFTIGFAFFGIPPLTTIIVTALMVLRLGLIRRRYIKLIGHSDSVTNQYTSIISMLIESYALEALWSIAIIITYSIRTPIIWTVFIGSAVNIKVIALFLIVYRVANGSAWQAHTEQQLSTLRCNGDRVDDSDSAVTDALDRRFSTGDRAMAA